MVAKPPGAGYTRHLYTAKWTPAACKYWNHWRPLEPNSSSLVVFHWYRWSRTPPGYYQLSSHYSLHWFQTPGSTSIWISTGLLQDWMQRAFYFQWFDLCTSPWRSTDSPTSQNIGNYQRWQASCVSLSLLPIRSEITCMRDYRRVPTKVLFIRPNSDHCLALSLSHQVTALVEYCSIGLNCLKLLHGFLCVIRWICQNL